MKSKQTFSVEIGSIKELAAVSRSSVHLYPTLTEKFVENYYLKAR